MPAWDCVHVCGGALGVREGQCAVSRPNRSPLCPCCWPDHLEVTPGARTAQTPLMAVAVLGCPGPL